MNLKFHLVPRPIGGDPYYEIWRDGYRIARLYDSGAGERIYVAENTSQGPVAVTTEELRAIIAFTEQPAASPQ